MSTAAVWWRAAWVLPVVGAAVALLAGIGIGAASRSASATKTTVTATATATATVIVSAPAPQDSTNLESPPDAGAVGDGTYVVGEDIKAGMWSTRGGNRCFWARKKDLFGNPDSIVAKGYITGPTVIEVATSDKALTLAGGCMWFRSPE